MITIILNFDCDFKFWLTDSLDKDTALVLVNAIYFKGIWQFEFKDKDTRNHDFYDSFGDDPISIPMMTIPKGNFSYGHSKSLKSDILTMKYQVSSDTNSYS